MAAKKPGRAGNTQEGELRGSPTMDAAAGGTQSAVPGSERTTTLSRGGRGASNADAGMQAAAATGGSRSKTTGQGTAKGGTRARSGSTGKESKEAGATATKGATRSRKADNGLQDQLRSFVDEHPQGWGHHDWEGLLGRLREGGHDTSDSERIGRDLEKQRLIRTLEGIAGLGPTRVRSLADRFETLWSLRNASIDDIASVSGINRSLAEKIHESVR